MNEVAMFENLVRGMLKKLYTALPGRITVVDPKNMKVKVMISRSEAYENKLETGWLPLKTIYAGEKHGLCMIPYVDDECVIFFQDKSLNDAFVLPFSFNNDVRPPKTPEGDLKIGDVLLQHKSGTYVYINPEGFVEVFEKEGNKVRMTDGYIQSKTRDGQEVQTQNTCNASNGDTKLLKQWTLIKNGNETLSLQDKRELASAADKSAKTNTIPAEKFTLDRGNTKDSKEAMEEYLERSPEIPYMDYHGMKYTQVDNVIGGDHLFKIGLEVAGSAGPKNLDQHDGKVPAQSFEQVIHNPHRHSLAVFRAVVQQDITSMSFTILRLVNGEPTKTGFDAKLTDTEAQFVLNGVDYGSTKDGGSRRYDDEVEHLKKELDDAFEVRDYPVEK